MTCTCCRKEKTFGLTVKPRTMEFWLCDDCHQEIKPKLPPKKCCICAIAVDAGIFCEDCRAKYIQAKIKATILKDESLIPEIPELIEERKKCLHLLG